MKKFMFLALGLLLALNLGCMLVDVQYPLITDNNGAGLFIVNTNGKAHVFESVQTLAQLPSGEGVELLAFINQDAKGYQRLDGYQLISPDYFAYQFHSDLYCSPDWTGCAFVSTQYNAVTGVACSWAAMGAKFNFNCVDVGFTGLCTTYRYGECGRTLAKDLSFSDVATLIGLGNQMPNGNLQYTITPSNLQVFVDGRELKLAGSADVRMTPQGQALVNATNPLMAGNAQRYAGLFNSTAATVTVGINNQIWLTRTLTKPNAAKMLSVF